MELNGPTMMDQFASWRRLPVISILGSDLMEVDTMFSY